jgi:hypothetical protein
MEELWSNVKLVIENFNAELKVRDMVRVQVDRIGDTVKFFK